MSETVLIELPSGLGINTNTRVTTDWASIKVLVESGVSMQEVASHFKITKQAVHQRSKKEAWLTPAKVESLRKEIGKRQHDVFVRSGKAADVNEIKAEIWKDRGEAMREKAFQIAQAALNGVDEAKARRFIQNPKGFLEMVTAARTLTGEAQADEANAPRMAVNISLLRSQPKDVFVEAEVMEG